MKFRQYIPLVIILIAILCTAIPVLAQPFIAVITVVETSGNDYTMLGMAKSANISWMATNGYTSATGLDTRVNKASVAIPHMLRDDNIMFADSLDAHNTNTYDFVTGESALSSFYVIPGYGGYVTRTDQANLELGQTFQVDQSGYFDTSATSSSTSSTLYKESAIRIWTEPTTISAATLVNANASYNNIAVNASLFYDDATYNTAWTGTTADATGQANIGQRLVMGPTYSIWRLPLDFNTAALPDNCVITNATININVTGDSSTTDFDVVVQHNAAGTYPSNPFVATDYNKAYYSGNYGSINTSAVIVGANNITLSASGRDLINRTGETKFMIRSSLDIAGTAPTGDEFLTLSGAAATSLTVYYDNQVQSVTFSPVTAGEHDVRVSGTGGGGNLELYIDDMGVAKDTDAIGAGVPDNGNTWYFMQYMPYMEYLKMTTNVGGYSEKLWYQPVSYIVSTTLPDRDGADNDGTFTFGANPSGVTATISSLVSVSVPVSGSDTQLTEDILSAFNLGNELTDESMALEDNEWYPMMSGIATQAGVPVQMTWWFICMALTISAIVLTYFFSGHLWGGGFAGLLMIGLFVALGAVPWYAIFFGIIIAVFFGLMERVTSI